jgi:hypothetical protein
MSRPYLTSLRNLRRLPIPLTRPTNCIGVALRASPISPKLQNRLFSSVSAFKFQARHCYQASVAPYVAQPVNLTDGEYHKIADNYIDVLVEALEDMQETKEDMDVEYHVRNYFKIFVDLHTKQSSLGFLHLSFLLQERMF